jgi:hypothetical protein
MKRWKRTGVSALQSMRPMLSPASLKHSRVDTGILFTEHIKNE